MICWGCSFENDLRSFVRQVEEDKIFTRLEFVDGEDIEGFGILQAVSLRTCVISHATIDLSRDHFSHLFGPIGSMGKGSFFRQLQLGSGCGD